VQRTTVAGARAQEPVASSEGLGGTYFFSSEAGGRVGIMKPVDEEPLAPNNPKARPRRYGAATVPGVHKAAGALLSRGAAAAGADYRSIASNISMLALVAAGCRV